MKTIPSSSVVAPKNADSIPITASVIFSNARSQVQAELCRCRKLNPSTAHLFDRRERLACKELQAGNLVRAVSILLALCSDVAAHRRRESAW